MPKPSPARKDCVLVGLTWREVLTTLAVLVFAAFFYRVFP